MSSISDAQRAALATLAPVVILQHTSAAAWLSHSASLTGSRGILTIAGRGARRDFWDLHALLATRKQGLREALDAYGQKYAAEDVGHVVRSLVYFADAESEPTLTGLTDEHWEGIKANLRDWVRRL